MENEISEKLETLLKYIPFIDFVLKTDKQKYVKFIDIRKWITIKKRYPLSDLNKIEQSIITQYKNLLLEDDKIPREIMEIFNKNIKHQYVDLCSDDEHELTSRLDKDKSKKDDNKLSKVEEKFRNVKENTKKTEAKLNSQIEAAKKKSKSSSKSDKKKDKDKNHKKISSLKKKKHDKQIANDDDSEDDIEIVSCVYLDKPAKVQPETKKESTSSAIAISCDKILTKDIINLDDISAGLLRKIDDLNNDDDNKNSNFHEPINYHKHSDDDDDEDTYKVKQEFLYQRRKSEDALFKRRDDFKELEEKPKSLEHKENSGQKSPTIICETISLDSSSDSESEANVPSTSAKALAALKNLKLGVNFKVDDSPRLSTSSVTKNIESNINVTKTLVDVENLNAKNVTDTLIEKPSYNATDSTEETADLVVLCRTETNHDNTLSNETKSILNIDKQTDLKRDIDKDTSIDLIDMDIDTENDLNDVLNEINCPADTNIKTTDVIIIDNLASFRNASPPPLPLAAAEAPQESLDTNSNKENLTTSTDDNHTNVIDTKNLRNLSQDQICKIFEDIESKSDIEIDKLLKTLSQICFQINTPTTSENNVKTNNSSPETPVGTVVHNDLTPPAPHFIPIAQSPQQQTSTPQPQQPIFYPNPLPPPPSIPPPPQHSYQLSNQHYLPPPQQQYNVAPNFIPTTPMPGLESSFTKINLKDPRIIRKLQMIKDSPLWSEFTRKSAESLSNAVCRKEQQQQDYAIPTFQTQPPQQQQYQHPQPPVVTNIPASSIVTPAPINNRRKSTTKSTINFGEYKRRQIEQQQELERKREEEKKRKEEALKTKKSEEINELERRENLKRDQLKEEALKAKKAQEIKEMERRENLKREAEIHSIIMSTLEPFKEKLTTIWNQRCNNNSSSTTSSQQSKKDDVSTKLKRTKETNHSPAQKEKDNINVSSSSKTQDKAANDKINRIYKELECTLKGYDRVQDYLPKSIGGKRRSSVHARSSIAEQLNSYQSDDFSDPTSDTTSKSIVDNSDSSYINSSQSIDTAALTPKPIGARRRSSVSARLAIVEQLNVLQKPSDNSDSDANSQDIYRHMPKLIAAKRRASTLARSAISEQLQQQTPTDYSDSSDINTSQSTTHTERRNSCSITKRRKTIDEPIQPRRRNTHFILRDDSSSSEEDIGHLEMNRLAKSQRLKESCIKNQPSVVLERISQEFIRKHTRRSPAATVSTTQNVLNVHLVESKTRPSKIEKPPAQKLAKPKRFNNDCQMTESNTKFCALCTSKPPDLTYHYKHKHKIESYVSRLTWSQLDDLCCYPLFVKLQPRSLNSRIDRYKVNCPFCDQHLLEPFMSLYDHYSTHTGEYAYRCSHCQLNKPYRADIQSHQLHSRACRNNTTEVVYRYPPNAQCIYLHYCTICNFVQLNEANILKHLREHHDPRKAVAENVQKCILAAISDAPDVSDKPPSEETNPNVEQEKLEIQQQNNNTQDIIVASTSSSTAKKPEIDFKVDDDDIPVSNEPCSQDPFEEGKFSLEEQLKQMHEEPLVCIRPMTVIHCGNQTITPKRKTNLTQSVSSPANNFNTLEKCLPMITKVEAMDVDENLLITPPRPSAMKLEATNKNNSTSNIFQEKSLVNLNNDQQTVAIISSNNSSTFTRPMDNIPHNESSLTKSFPVYEKYHNYPENVNYLGLYKCMADDCYYSTDSSDDIWKHLDDHTQDGSPSEYLQCPYCIITDNVQITSLQLIEHIRSQHQHMIYQCAICCYRSCEASNVLVHQQQSHLASALNAQVYKCSGIEINFNEKESYINEKIIENVRKISCPYCKNASFYNSNLIVQHMTQQHKVSSIDLKVYSCIYCPLTDRDQNVIRKHLSTKHPEELPYIYDHNNITEIAQDPLINHLNILSVSQPVSCLDANTKRDGVEEEEAPIEDVKPELDELIKMNEETIKVRLRKLTAHTGIPPDSLYRCPDSTCGGFFSIFELWLRHMRTRHHCYQCECPHCPTKQKNTDIGTPPRPLESFSDHFEEHRRHTFICFYCSTTSPNEILARQHAAEQHSNFADIRLEQIRFNVNYSYFITIQSCLFTERVEFINEFLAILDKRLQDMETLAVQDLKHQWLIQPNASWLDEVPKIYNRRSFKKCLDSTCKFRSFNEDVLLQHMNTNHESYRSQFNCKKCHREMQCNNWNDIFEHRKLHLEDSVFICVACLLTTTSRSKLANHIREQHAARDVPVIEHISTKPKTSSFIKLAVVFANDHLTFSTIRNCFCCDEKHMNGDAFNLHLRRYHKLTLNYFCEWCINTQFKSLEEVKSHFQSFHTTEAIKIRCELAFKGEVFVTSLDVFQLEIANEHHEQVLAAIEVKQEPDYDSMDDDVVILENDDIVIQESLKTHQLAGEVSEKPKLKCISMNNLLQAESSNQSTMQIVADEAVIDPPQTSTSSLNYFPSNDSSVDDNTAFSHGIGNSNNHNLPSAAVPYHNNSSSSQNNMGAMASNNHHATSTFNSHTNVQTAGKAPNLPTTSLTTNNPNFANVSSSSGTQNITTIITNNQNYANNSFNYNNGISTNNNQNVPSTAVPNYNNRSQNNMSRQSMARNTQHTTSTLNSHNNVPTFGRAQNLPTTLYTTTNNQNFANVPTDCGTQNITNTNTNNQNYANNSYVLPHPTRSLDVDDFCGMSNIGIRNMYSPNPSFFIVNNRLPNTASDLNFNGEATTVNNQNLPSSSSAAVPNYNNPSSNNMASMASNIQHATSTLNSHTNVPLVGRILTTTKLQTTPTSTLNSHTNVPTVGRILTTTKLQTTTNNRNSANVPTTGPNQNYAFINAQNGVVGNLNNVRLCYNGQSIFKRVNGVDQFHQFHPHESMIGMPMPRIQNDRLPQ